MKKIVVVLSHDRDLRPAFLRVIRQHAGHFSIIQMNGPNAIQEMAKNPKEVAVFVCGRQTFDELQKRLVYLGVPVIVVTTSDTQQKRGADDAHVVANKDEFPGILGQVLEKSNQQ